VGWAISGGRGRGRDGDSPWPERHERRDRVVYEYYINRGYRGRIEQTTKQPSNASII
jgi:hypothetical protein